MLVVQARLHAAERKLGEVKRGADRMFAEGCRVVRLCWRPWLSVLMQSSLTPSEL